MLIRVKKGSASVMLQSGKRICCFIKLRKGASICSFCWLVGWSDGWSVGYWKKVWKLIAAMCKTKTTEPELIVQMLFSSSSTSHYYYQIRASPTFLINTYFDLITPKGMSFLLCFMHVT